MSWSFLISLTFSPKTLDSDPPVIILLVSFSILTDNTRAEIHSRRVPFTFSASFNAWSRDAVAGNIRVCEHTRSRSRRRRRPDCGSCRRLGAGQSESEMGDENMSHCLMLKSGWRPFVSHSYAWNGGRSCCTFFPPRDTGHKVN